jgi:hypothetical protein
MRNIYSLLSFAFVMCILCLNTYANENDSSTVSKNPKDSVVSENHKSVLYGDQNLIGLKRNSQSPGSELKLKINHMLGKVADDEDKGIPILFMGVMNFCGRYRNIKTKDWPTQHKTVQAPYNQAAFISLNMNMQVAPGFNTIITLGLAPGTLGTPQSGFNGSTNPDSARYAFASGNFNAIANYKTRYAMIKVGGGSMVTGMSNLFVNGSGNVGRTSPFYAVPWDSKILTGGAFMTADNSIFRYGTGNANLDPFFTNGGRTRGYILQLSQMPLDLGLNVCYGLDQQTGSFNINPTAYSMDPTKKTLGTRLYKKIGTNQFAANLIINKGHFETVATKLRETQYMWSGDVFLRLFDYYTIQAEAGATAFTNPYGKWDPDQTFNKFYGKNVISDPKLVNEYKSPVSFVGKLNVQVDQRKFGIPIQLGLYSLGPNYVNLNSNTYNSSTYNNSLNYITVGQGWDYTMRRGVITDVGATSNNRRGAELNTSLGQGKFRINMGTQVSQEIQKEDSTKLNQVMFNHRLNVFSTSSFQPWQAAGGPYGTLLSTYFQLQEKVHITDQVIDYRKTFNSIYFDARYKTSLFGKQLLMENYMNYQSASDHFSPLPFVTSNAFVRVFFNEFVCWYRLKKNVTFVGLASMQTAKANNRTTLADSNGNIVYDPSDPTGKRLSSDATKGKPIDQIAYGFGGGLDFDIDASKGLYWRVMWNSHKDNHFTKDSYTLFETTIDFKLYF